MPISIQIKHLCVMDNRLFSKNISLFTKMLKQRINKHTKIIIRRSCYKMLKYFEIPFTDHGGIIKKIYRPN